MNENVKNMKEEYFNFIKENPQIQQTLYTMAAKEAYISNIRP